MADARASLALISLCSSVLLRPVRDEDWWVEVLRVVVAVAVVVIELVVAASVALVGLGARVSVYATYSDQISYPTTSRNYLRHISSSTDATTTNRTQTIMSSRMNALSAAVASEEANERVSTERAVKFVPAGDAAAVKSEETTDETLTSTSSSPSANTPAATEPKPEKTTAAAAAVQPSIGVDDDSDSDIEDVTDQYVQKPRAPSPEIIEVED
eukprot:scaffold1309_cov76-Alexandrium_tamarense.AAC.1